MRTLVNLDQLAGELDTQLDTQLAELARVIRDGLPGDAIDAATDAIDATEQAIADLAKRRYQQEKYLTRKAAQAVADEDAIDVLVAGGMNAEDARAQVTGVDVEKQRKRDFLAMVRNNGITAVGFDEAVRKWHTHLAVEIVDSLETIHAHHFRGALAVNARAERAGVTAYELFFMSHNRVRECASEEMLAWFDKHGRLTRDDVRAQALGKRVSPDQDYLQ